MIAGFTKLSALVLAVLVSATQIQADVIDSFDDPGTAAPYQIALLNGNPFLRTDVLSNGLTRTLRVEVVSPVPPLFDSATGSIGGGIFRLNAESDAVVTASLTYTGFGSLALAESFDLSFLTWDSGNTQTTAPVSLDVATTSGTLNWTGSIADSGTPFTRTVPLTAFTGSGDLNNVTSVQFNLNSGSSKREALDVRMTELSVQQVPAPMGLVALLSVAPGLVFLRRRSAKAQA